MTVARVIWTLMLLVCVAPAIAAGSFDMDLVIVEDSVFPGDSALFELELTNKLDVPDNYVISSQEYSYILVIDPRPSEIQPGESGVFGLEVSPRSFVNVGTHRVPIKIRSIVTGETDEINPLLSLRDPDREVGVYAPSVALSVGAPDEVNPRDNLLLNIHLRNRNARVYSGDDPITVRIESDIFFRQYNTSLGGVGVEGEKSSEIRMELDPYQVPGTHPLTVKLLVDGEIISTQELDFEVVSYNTVEEVTFSESSLFKYTTTYKLRNDGNVPTGHRIVYPVPALTRLFVSASENYVVEDVEVVPSMIIDLGLDPLEERTIAVTENYRLLIVLLILIILSAIGYYLLRSPVMLAKEASVSGSVEDGVSQIKVRLFLKNRSSKTLRNLRVIDRITGVAEVIQDNALGTVKPTKIVKKKGQGTLLRWDLEQLEPFEERIITYKVKTPLTLVGEVTLPSMKMKYDLPSGRERTVHSDEVAIGARQ